MRASVIRSQSAGWGAEHQLGSPVGAQLRPAADRRSAASALAIVDQVADDWGVEPQSPGKVVWAEFDRNRRADIEDK
jgi:hypothetical protein